MAVMGGSFALLVLGAAADRWAPVFGIVIGVSYSVQGTIGPAFIVGADLSHAQVAKQLSAYNLAFPAGQLIGSLVIAAMQAAGWSTAQVFLAATAVTLLLAAISWPAMTVPARRLTAATLAPPVHDAEDAAHRSGRPDGGSGRCCSPRSGCFYSSWCSAPSITTA
jgi:MFS family permease